MFPKGGGHWPRRWSQVVASGHARTQVCCAHAWLPDNSSHALIGRCVARACPGVMPSKSDVLKDTPRLRPDRGEGQGLMDVWGWCAFFFRRAQGQAVQISALQDQGGVRGAARSKAPKQGSSYVSECDVEPSAAPVPGPSPWPRAPLSGAFPESTGRRVPLCHMPAAFPEPHASRVP